MKESEKFVIKEGVFNWLLKTLVGKDAAIKLKYYTAIKTDRKLTKLSRELEKTVSAMKQQMKKTHGSEADLDKWLRGE